MQVPTVSGGGYSAGFGRGRRRGGPFHSPPSHPYRCQARHGTARAGRPCKGAHARQMGSQGDTDTARPRDPRSLLVSRPIAPSRSGSTTPGLLRNRREISVSREPAALPGAIASRVLLAEVTDCLCQGSRRRYGFRQRRHRCRRQRMRPPRPLLRPPEQGYSPTPPLCLVREQAALACPWLHHNGLRILVSARRCTPAIDPARPYQPRLQL